jgi:hypothetical protein
LRPVPGRFGHTFPRDVEERDAPYFSTADLDHCIVSI